MKYNHKLSNLRTFIHKTIKVILLRKEAKIARLFLLPLQIEKHCARFERWRIKMQRHQRLVIACICDLMQADFI